mgnify:CR=1 FL=1
MNQHTGVLGTFNCQGAGWCKEEKTNVIHDKEPVTITGSVRAEDVDLISNICPEGWTGDCAVFTHKGGIFILIKNLQKGSSSQGINVPLFMINLAFILVL